MRRLLFVAAVGYLLFTIGFPGMDDVVDQMRGAMHIQPINGTGSPLKRNIFADCSQELSIYCSYATSDVAAEQCLSTVDTLVSERCGRHLH